MIYNFGRVYERAIRERYSEGFDLKDLEGLSSFTKRLDYVSSKLARIAAGSSRIVYAVDEEKVLKVAKNSKGLAQNLEEISVGSDYISPDILAKVFDSSEDGKFLEMERADKITAKDFERLVGVSLEKTTEYLRYISYEVLGQQKNRGFRISKPENIEELDNNEFLCDLVELGGSWNFPLPGDFSRLSTYGKVIRDGIEQVVVIDYGYRGDVVSLYGH